MIKYEELVRQRRAPKPGVLIAGSVYYTLSHIEVRRPPPCSRG